MRSLFCSLAACILLPFGCGGDTSAAKKVEEAKVKIGEAGSATLEAAKAKRDEFVVEMNKQLVTLDAKYEELKAKAAAAAPEAKANMQKMVDDAKVKRDEAAKKLEELKSAGAERWEKVKTGVGDAMEDLKKAFK